MKLLGVISVDCGAVDQMLCIYQILEKKWEYNGQYISYLHISRRPMTLLEEKYCTILLLNFVYV